MRSPCESSLQRLQRWISEEWGGADHIGLFLKRSVYEAEVSGGCIHAVGVAEGNGEHSGLEVVEVSQRTSPEAVEESPNVLASVSGETE